MFLSCKYSTAAFCTPQGPDEEWGLGTKETSIHSTSSRGLASQPHSEWPHRTPNGPADGVLLPTQRRRIPLHHTERKALAPISTALAWAADGRRNARPHPLLPGPSASTFLDNNAASEAGTVASARQAQQGGQGRKEAGKVGHRGYLFYAGPSSLKNTVKEWAARPQRMTGKGWRVEAQENDSPTCQVSETPASNLPQGRDYGKGLPPSPDADAHEI